MAIGRRFLYKIRNFLRPSPAEQDLEREIHSHLELLEERFRQRGMGDDEARLAARRAYGGIEQAKELQRDERSWIWMEQVRQEVRIAGRALRKSPGFTITAILTLALGMGANTAIFSLIDAVMLKTIPVKQPQRLLQVNMGRTDVWGMNNPFMSNPVWEQLRDRQDVFSGLLAYSIARFNLAARGEARYVQGNYASGQFFETLGLHPILGRTFRTNDDRPGCDGTAVLSYGFWKSEYGGRTDIVGKTISLDNHAFQILGVIGRGFTGLDVGRQSEVYVPLCAEKIVSGKNSALEDAGAIWLRAVGRPKAGISASQAEARLKALARPIFEATIPLRLRPDQRETYLKRTFEIETAAHGVSGIRSKYKQPLLVLMAVAGLVLLITCANVANLFLARSAAKQREIAIRMALGSGRTRLFRHLLAESIMLTSSGAVLGLIFAHWGARLLTGMLASNVYQENKVFLDLSLDTRVLGFAVILASLTGLLFGLAPARKAARVDLQSALKANWSGLSGRSRFGPGKTLVITQMALSLVLVSGANLLLSTFLRLETLDPGFERENVLLVNAETRTGEYTPEQRRSLFEQMLQRLRTLPDVRSASYSEVTPVDGSVYAGYAQTEESAAKGGQPTLIYLNQVSDGFFETLGTRVLGGRDFNGRDTINSPKVALVNETLARKFFGARNAIGRRYRSVEAGKPGDRVEIVGVVKDARYADLRDDVPPTAYVSTDQDPNSGEALTFEIRARVGPPTSLMNSVKSAMANVDQDIMLQFKTFAIQVDESLARERMLATLSAFFGGLALLLAMLGLYGMVSYNVDRRRSEIGIRMALGAERGRVLLTVLREVTILVVIGLGVGVCITMSTTRFLASLLYGVRANDMWAMGVAAAVLASVAMAAGLLPANRASRLNPMTTLREE